MSKIYERYLELKKEDSNKLYLFKSGKFYIFIADDCELINEYIVLKKVNFAKGVMKCGFPENVLDDYMRVFKNHNLDVEVITNVIPKDFDSADLYEYIKKIDIDNITPMEALNKLRELKEFALNEQS